MSKKLLLAGLGAALIIGGFFVGMKYRETPKDNTKNDIIKEEPVLNLDSLLDEANRYSAGENRTISSMKNLEGKITLGFVYEVKNVVDQENSLSYRIYRVGEGDVPSAYSAGRVFLQVTELIPPSYPGRLYDTEIDALELEPLGKTYIRGGKLIIACSVKDFTSKNFCEYQVNFSKDSKNLEVIRNI